MIEVLAIILLGVLGLSAAYFDLKKQVIPDYFSLPLLFGSIILLAISGKFQELAWLALFIILDYLFYHLGVWAGGDFKLTAGIIGILLFYSKVESFKEIVILIGLFLGIAFGLAIVSSVIKRLSLIKERKKEITISIIKNSITTLLLIQSILFLSSKMNLYLQIMLGIIVLLISLFVNIPIIITGIIFLVAIIIEPMQTIEKSIYSIPIILLVSMGLNVIKIIPLKQKINAKELREGIILEGEYYLENQILKHETGLMNAIMKPKTNVIYSDKSARGLTQKEINELKKHGFTQGFQKLTLPLSPFLIISSLILLILKIT